jgi:hypothetical protein
MEEFIKEPWSQVSWWCLSKRKGHMVLMQYNLHPKYMYCTIYMLLKFRVKCSIRRCGFLRRIGMCLEPLAFHFVDFFISLYKTINLSIQKVIAIHVYFYVIFTHRVTANYTCSQVMKTKCSQNLIFIRMSAICK